MLKQTHHHLNQRFFDFVLENKKRFVSLICIKEDEEEETISLIRRITTQLRVIAFRE